MTLQVLYLAHDLADPAIRRRVLTLKTGGASVKLYVRPEHTLFTADSGVENSVPVTVQEVAFEGSFISVHALSDSGASLVAELRNDGSQLIPEAGQKGFMTFASERASILPDGIVRAK